MNKGLNSLDTDEDEGTPSPSVESFVASVRELIAQLRTNPPSDMSPGRFIASIIELEHDLLRLEAASADDDDGSLLPAFALRNIVMRRIEDVPLGLPPLKPRVTINVVDRSPE